MSVRTVLGLLVVVGCVASLRAQSAAPAAAAPGANPQFAAALQRGEAALRLKQYENALDAFTAANVLMQKQSATAIYGLARAYHGLGAWKSEVDACTEALKFVGDDKPLEGLLHNQRGLAYIQIASKPTDKALRDAEMEFRATLLLPAPAPIAWFNLGIVLLKQARDPEGVAALQSFVEAAPKMAEAETAKKMIENPRRARENFAPEFAIATMDGVYLNLKEMQGKVVLIDFWGTWCGPCVAATPMLGEIYKARSKDARFQMISISNDKPTDVNVLKDFIAANKMVWPQIHDTGYKVLRPYDVTHYPTYVVIDHEGIIRVRLEGYGSNTRKSIDNAITDALRAMQKK